MKPEPQGEKVPWDSVIGGSLVLLFLLWFFFALALPIMIALTKGAWELI